MSEGRNEEREMSRRIRGGRDFDLSLRALVFTFNTAAGTSPSPSLTLLPLSITSLQHTSPPSFCFCDDAAADAQLFPHFSSAIYSHTLRS